MRNVSCFFLPAHNSRLRTENNSESVNVDNGRRAWLKNSHRADDSCKRGEGAV